MKTKNLFRSCLGFAVIALVSFPGCSEDEPFPEESVPEGLAVRSVQFYFTNVSDGTVESVFEYYDNDGCCQTPAEKVDTFRLMSDQIYVCEIKLNRENLKDFFAGTGESEEEYSFSYIPQNGLDLMINQPDKSKTTSSDLSSKWTTGNPGNGIVNFRIRYCPYVLADGLCYEISLPVAIISSENYD